MLVYRGKANTRVGTASAGMRGALTKLSSRAGNGDNRAFAA